MYALNVSELTSANTHSYLHEYSIVKNKNLQSEFIKESSATYNEPESLPTDNDQLADQITTLAGQINAANYRFLKLIAEFERRKAWAGYGLRSCAHWLSWKCGIDMGAAREKVRAALALTDLPEINSAFEKGSISFSKVRAMTKIATKENESFLLNIAEYGTAQHMEKLVKAYRTVSHTEKAEEVAAENVSKEQHAQNQERKKQQRQQENRSVICYQDDDGMWIIHAKLPAEEGGLVAKALQELGDKLADTKLDDTKLDDTKIDSTRTEGREKIPKNVSAETFSLDQPQEKLTFPQRRADALIAISEHYLASANTSSSTLPLASLKGAERCQLILHVQAGSLNERKNQDANLDGRWLIPNAARRIACDAGLLVVEEDEVGNVLNIGRRSRTIPPAMSRALAIRDGGCQFPGCCETRYVEGHHIKHWADGGETKLDNLVTLCRYHHRELHKGSFFLSVNPASNNLITGKPQRFVERLCFSKIEKFWNAPFNRSKQDKNIIAANPATFTCACCDSSAIDSELKDAIPNEIYHSIDEKTAVTKWAGEQMDLGMAIDGLLGASKKRFS